MIEDRQIRSEEKGVAEVPDATLSKPRLVRYEWRWTEGERYSTYEEGFVKSRVSDWDRSEISEISGREIVHIYWIKGADGVTRPYGKESARKALGLGYGDFEFTIKPIINKFMKDKREIEWMLAEFNRRAESDRPEGAEPYMSAVSANPWLVYEFARRRVFHAYQHAKHDGERMTFNKNALFFRIKGCWATIVPDNDTLANAVSILEQHGYGSFTDWTEMRRLADAAHDEAMQIAEETMARNAARSFVNLWTRVFYRALSNEDEAAGMTAFLEFAGREPERQRLVLAAAERACRQDLELVDKMTPAEWLQSMKSRLFDSVQKDRREGIAAETAAKTTL